MAGLVFRVCMGDPNISGVQISHDSSYINLSGTHYVALGY